MRWFSADCPFLSAGCARRCPRNLVHITGPGVCSLRQRPPCPHFIAENTEAQTFMGLVQDHAAAERQGKLTQLCAEAESLTPQAPSVWGR